MQFWGFGVRGGILVGASNSGEGLEWNWERIQDVAVDVYGS